MTGCRKRIKVKALIDFAAALFKELQTGGIDMYLLPRPKKVEERQGAYEIGWNTVITIDGTLSENGCVYEIGRASCRERV